jgi:hypothetical protein
LKLVYVCECCDMIVHSLEVEARSPGEIQSALTGNEPQNIINVSVNGEQVIFTILCEECREDLYGESGSMYFSGPVLN